MINLWEKLVQKLKKKDSQLITSIIRNIWLRRNKFIFEQKFDSPRTIVSKKVENLDAFHEVKTEMLSKQKNREITRREVKWKKPGDNMLKVNWDASFNSK